MSNKYCDKHNAGWSDKHYSSCPYCQEDSKMLIPEHEQQNVLDIFWSMLRYIEVRVKEEDILAMRDVEYAYKLLNRLGITKSCP